MSNPITIDMTPTWGEVGNLYIRFAESGERNAVRELRDQAARAFAFAEAFKAIHAALPAELRETAEKTVSVELRKQGVTA